MLSSHVSPHPNLMKYFHTEGPVCLAFRGWTHGCWNCYPFPFLMCSARQPEAPVLPMLPWNPTSSLYFRPVGTTGPVSHCSVPKLPAVSPQQMLPGSPGSSSSHRFPTSESSALHKEKELGHFSIWMSFWCVFIRLSLS